MSQEPRGRALAPGLGLVLAAVGGALLAAAVVRDRNAMQMLPGMDGCLTAGVLAALLPLLEGLSYRTAISLMAPVIALQALGCRAAGAALLPVLGPELLIVGLIGVIPWPWLRAAGPPAPAPVRPGEGRESSPLVTSHAS